VTAPAATTHIAMLRGINVSGHKIVKMDRLRESFEALGFGNVRTYVQSGNVVFEAKVGAPAELPTQLATKIAARIARDFGFSVPVTVLTSDEMGRLVKENPFLTEEGIDLSKLHVTFLSDAPPGAGLKKLGGVPAGPDRFHCRGRSVYLHCPEGYGNTKLSNNAIENALAVGATTRNWKTVTTLHQMSLKMSPDSR
jgi:uncharacterized protein (DUF1697 family)